MLATTSWVNGIREPCRLLRVGSRAVLLLRRAILIDRSSTSPLAPSSVSRRRNGGLECGTESVSRARSIRLSTGHHDGSRPRLPGSPAPVEARESPRHLRDAPRHRCVPRDASQRHRREQGRRVAGRLRPSAMGVSCPRCLKPIAARATDCIGVPDAAQGGAKRPRCV